jgi:molybdopterin/thiamine biosynthesis adenylyltransferase
VTTATLAGEVAAGAATLPRNIRQAEIVPQDELERVAAVVIGCGAIGSWLARLLAHLGVTYFLLADPDSVDHENLALQGFPASDLGRNKAEATAEMALEVNPACRADFAAERFRRDHLKLIPRAYGRVAVFACVDDIEARAFLYRATRGKCALYVDGRMAALAWRVLTVDDPGDDHYETTLFKSSEANVLRCTAKGTVGTAVAPANQMAVQLMLHLKGCTTFDGNLARDVEGNLLATTFEVRA